MTKLESKIAEAMNEKDELVFNTNERNFIVAQINGIMFEIDFHVEATFKPEPTTGFTRVRDVRVNINNIDALDYENEEELDLDLDINAIEEELERDLTA